MKRWKVGLAREATIQLAAITDVRIRERISKRITQLEYEPERQGKPLHEDLDGYRSVRAAGRRYRIIYEIEKEQVIVTVIMASIRKEGDKKDAYALAEKLAKLNLLD